MIWLEPTMKKAMSWMPRLQLMLVRQWNVWIFVLKTVLSALLALWIAYRFNLRSPSTAVITVFIVMQSRNGMVLAKGFYRALGTIIGSAVSVGLVSAFAEERVLFLLGLTIWVGFCTAGARYFRNFQAYAFVLAGYTAVLVALPAAVQPLNTFNITISRVSDVLVGIVIASLVSAIVFPQPLESLLLTTARQRFFSFLEISQRVLAGTVDQNCWSTLHVNAINETIKLDSYRSSSIFESNRARLQHRHVQQMIAESMAAGSSLHLLNTYIQQIRNESSGDLYVTFKPLLERFGKILVVSASQFGEASHQLVTHLKAFESEMREAVIHIRSNNQGTLTGERLLVFDTVIFLLSQFLREMILFCSRFEAFQNGTHTAPSQHLAQLLNQSHKHEPAIRLDRPKTDLIQPLVAAARTTIVVTIMSMFWIYTNWPSGVIATVIAVVISALFSTFPDPAAAAKQMITGFIAAFCAAIAYTFIVLPHIQGFFSLSLTLLPFLAIGPYILSSSRWAGVAAGYGILFPQLAIPDNYIPFNYSSLVNNGLGELMGVALVALVFMVIMPAGNWLERYRLSRALRMQVIASCRKPLRGLRASFERDTRELLRQLVSDATDSSGGRAEIFRTALRIQGLGEAVIQLRSVILRSDASEYRKKHSSLVATIQGAISDLEKLYCTADINRVKATTASFEHCLVLVRQFGDISSDLRRLGTGDLILIHLGMILDFLNTIQTSGRTNSRVSGFLFGGVCHAS
ncbi:FUSC family protein [Acidithiobacillus ferriphilus]|nr:FUSC family protein [Acidithiobacillus ferriphilus]